MLGVGYDIKADRICISFSPTYHTKGRGGTETSVHLSHQDIAQIREGQGRSAASYVMGHYNPLGLTLPISMRTKLLLRKSHVASESWDQEIPNDIKREWGGLIGELQEAGTVFFPRSVVPGTAAANQPILVGFGDGSTIGFAAMIYTVWPRDTGGAVVNLIIAKSKVAPAAGMTVPRTEMSVAALMARLMLLDLHSSGFKAAEVVMALDLECSVAALQKAHGLLRPFFVHRSAEVHEALRKMRRLCKQVLPVVAIRGTQNRADIATRGRAMVADISPESRW